MEASPITTEECSRCGTSRPHPNPMSCPYEPEVTLQNYEHEDDEYEKKEDVDEPLPDANEMSQL